MRPIQKPPARVRRVLDVEPLERTLERFMLRPFVEFFDRGAHLSPLILRGEMRGAEFQVSVSDAATVVLVGEPGSDTHGSFTSLLAQEHAVGPRHALRVEADAHDVDSSPAVLSYFELTRDAVARLEVAYAERWYSVHFNPLGLVDGTSSGQPRSLRPPPLSS